LVGFGTAFFLVAATRRLQFGLPATRLTRVLEHPVSVKLGEFSYSTYLLHYPLVAVLSLWLMDLGVGPLPHFAILLSGGLVVCLLVAYAFHRVFERPFMRRIGVASLRSHSIPPAADVEELKSAAP
jgi:peptidoglycan/LPS O-acetylase OafA/YrhL